VRKKKHLREGGVRERRSGQFGRTPRSHVHARNTCFSHALVARARERVCATRIWIKHRSRFSDVERIKRRLILGHRLQILRVHGSQQRSREMSASCLRLPIMIRSFLSEAYQNTSTSRGGSIQRANNFRRIVQLDRSISTKSVYASRS